MISGIMETLTRCLITIISSPAWPSQSGPISELIKSPLTASEFYFGPNTINVNWILADYWITPLISQSELCHPPHLLPFQDGQTVLHLAAGAGHLDTVEALLDRGCDANVQDFVSCKSVWMRWAANLYVSDWPHCAAESGLRRSLEYREVTSGPGRQPRPPGMMIMIMGVMMIMMMPTRTSCTATRRCTRPPGKGSAGL